MTPSTVATPLYTPHPYRTISNLVDMALIFDLIVLTATIIGTSSYTVESLRRQTEKFDSLLGSKAIGIIRVLFYSSRTYSAVIFIDVICKMFILLING